MLGKSGQAVTAVPVTVAGNHYSVEVAADGMVTTACLLAAWPRAPRRTIFRSRLVELIRVFARGKH